MTQKATKVRALTEGAIMIAAATVLGYLRIFRFPSGGSVDLALVPILVYCLRWGPKYSLLCCFVNGVLQYFLGGGIAISWQSMLLDYVAAYTLVFLCGFGAGKKFGWLWGTVLGSFGRWICLTLSGGLLWYMYMPETFLVLFQKCKQAVSGLFQNFVFIHFCLHIYHRQRYHCPL